MPTYIEGALTPGDARFAIVVSRFNAFITEKLLDGALDVLQRHQANMDGVTIVRCPGSFEVPIVARRLAESGQHDAIICLGAVIRGETTHYDLVAGGVANGVAQVALQTGVPIIFGVITTDTVEQAIDRAGTKAGNKGADAATSAIEMVNLLRTLQ